MSGPYVLVPQPVTDAVLSSASIAEPAVGETVWNSATSYTAGQEVIRTQTHRVYECVIPGVSAVTPESSVGVRWLDKRPTNRWAAFDAYTTTQSSDVTSMSYVLLPGLFNAIAGYAIEGQTLNISIKDAPGGAVVFTRTLSLIEPPLDYYDYYFGRIKTLTKFLVNGLLPYGNPEVTITVTAAVGAPVKIGMLIFGDQRDLSSDAFGGVGYGAKASPRTSSLFIDDGFGDTKIIRRTRSTDMSFSATVSQAQAGFALAALQDVLDVPAAWIATESAGYEGLSVYGIASGDVTYAGPNHATIDLNVKGLL